MRGRVLFAAALLVVASPAAAQFNAYYEGTQRVDGKDVPVKTRFSVEKGLVVARFDGTKSFRMIFDEKAGVLRIVDDTARSYVDLGHDELKQMGGGAMAEMQKQMEQMPPEQRAMAEKMMGGAMGAMKTPEPETYVWSNEKQTIKGYDCTRVDVMRGAVKRAEYWGTPSTDFELTKDEHKTILAMQDELRSFTIMVTNGGPGGETRPFAWDTRSDGFPLISRCFDGGVMTLDLHLAGFDRKALDPDLGAIPKDYTAQDFGGGSGAQGSRKHHGSPRR